MGGSMLLVLVLVALVAPCKAWWDNGHMMTAEIARRQLTDKQIETINDVLQDWTDDFPRLDDMVSAAVWPDVIKCAEVSEICRKPLPDAIAMFDGWHFDDRPYNPDNLHLSDIITDTWANQPSATWLLGQINKTFRKTQTRFAYNLFLRFLLHVIGDLHQPLHTVSGYFNDTTHGALPDGDRGGNLIYLHTSWSGITNLHSLWDAVGGLYQNNWPLSEEKILDLRKNATELMGRFPKDSKAFNGRYLNGSDIAACWNATTCLDVFLRWGNESYQLAVSEAYPGIANHGTPSEEYIQNAQAVCEVQLVLGGYRLGDLLRHTVEKMGSLPPRQDNNNNNGSDEWKVNSTAKVLLGVVGGLSFVVLALLFVLVRSPKSPLTRRLVDV